MSLRDDNQHRLLIGELLDTRQFPEAVTAFLSGYVNDSQQKLILAVKSGDISKANYQCGVTETLSNLLSKMESYAKRAISTN